MREDVGAWLAEMFSDEAHGNNPVVFMCFCIRFLHEPDIGRGEVIDDSVEFFHGSFLITKDEVKLS